MVDKQVRGKYTLEYKFLQPQLESGGKALGGKVYFRVSVFHDTDAGVYVATSQDIRGLVVEAQDLDDLMREVSNAAQDLVGENRTQPLRPSVDFSNTFCAA